MKGIDKSKAKEEIGKHVMVQNPITGEYMDMLPIFELLANCRQWEEEDSANSPTAAACMLDELHNFISIHTRIESTSLQPQFQTSLWHLVEFKKAFRRTKVLS